MSYLKVEIRISKHTDEGQMTSEMSSNRVVTKAMMEAAIVSDREVLQSIAHEVVDRVVEGVVIK